MIAPNLSLEVPVPAPRPPAATAAACERRPPAVARVVSIRSGREVDPALAERRRQDRALVDGILGGDPDAFARLHALYAPRIHRFAVSRLGGDSAEAEDVVQDVFLEVHRCLGSWEGRSALLTWMFGIAHHQLCRRFRRRTPVGLAPEHLEALSEASEPDVGEERVDAVRALGVCAEVLEAEVSPAQREVFERYYGGSRPIREIARDLDKSVQAVKISLFRTRRAMEARLAEAGLEPIA